MKSNKPMNIFIVLLVIMAFAACDEAKAGTTLLTGAIHIANTGSFKVPHTVVYNAIYGTPSACEDAKTAAINVPIDTPDNSGVVYGSFNRVVTLTCTEKSVTE